MNNTILIWALFFTFSLGAHGLEARFKVLDHGALTAFLAEKGSAPVAPVITNFNYYDKRDRALFERGIEICICDEGKLNINWDPKRISLLALDGIISDDVYWSGKQSFSHRLRVDEKAFFKDLNTCLPLLISSSNGYSIPDYLALNGLEYFAMVRIHRKTYDLGSFLLMDDEIERVGNFISVKLKEPDSEDDDSEDDAVAEESYFEDFLSPLLRDRRHFGSAIQKTEQTYLQIVVEAADRHARK